MRSGVRRTAGLAVSTLAAFLAAGAAAGQEKGAGPPPRKLVFKSIVINAPEMAVQNKSVVADVLKEAFRDRPAGKSKQLTDKEAREIGARLERAFRLNRSTEGLQSAPAANGMVSLDLQGRFQYILLSRTNPDGSTSTACVSDWDSAQAFLSGAGGTATE